MLPSVKLCWIHERYLTMERSTDVKPNYDVIQTFSPAGVFYGGAYAADLLVCVQEDPAQC